MPFIRLQMTSLHPFFPTKDKTSEFIDEVVARLGESRAGKLMAPIWDRAISKREVVGIHGTLFYGLPEKKKFYENKREPVIDWRLVD